MRRWFIALLTLLVTAQLSWAGASLCCVDELGERHTAQVSGDTVSHDVASADAHAVCETAGHCHCHHGGCAAPAAVMHSPAASQHPAHEPVQAARLKSHIPKGLERPNWQRA